MSIQLKLGGLSFSAKEVAFANDCQIVEFVVDTPRVTLAPRSEVSPESATQLLRLADRACRSHECSVCSDLQADIVAVMAVDKKALDAIVEQWGNRATFSSPLLDMRHANDKGLAIYCSERVCYMHLFDDGLQRAEAFDYATEEDILYYTTEWVGNNDYTICIKGNGAAAKLLRRYFKNVVCE